MTYYVTYKINARFVAKVEANDLDEARDLAEAEFIDADFGAAEDINGEEIIVEDGNGNYVWER